MEREKEGREGGREKNRKRGNGSRDEVDSKNKEGNEV